MESRYPGQEDPSSEADVVEGIVIEETTLVVEDVTVEQIAVEQIVILPRPRVHHFLSWMLLDRARSMLSLLVIAVFVLTFILQPFRIPSESMERTLLIGDFLLVNKARYGPPGAWGWLLPYRTPQRGDIIVFRFPLNAEEHVVKRVIGAPGDHIHMQAGVVYRNGVPLQEPYTAQLGSRTSEPDVFRDDFPAARFTDPGVDAHWWSQLRRSLVPSLSSAGDLPVPSNTYFVMGDNRNHSRDSRYWGFVPVENVVGLPMLIYFSVREPSRTDPATPDDKLARSALGQALDFARWERTLRVVY